MSAKYRQSSKDFHMQFSVNSIQLKTRNPASNSQVIKQTVVKFKKKKLLRQTSWNETATDQSMTKLLN